MAKKTTRKKAPKEADPASSLSGLPTEDVLVDDLISDVANANTHDERSIKQIAESLRRFGQVEDLIVRGDSNVVIGGNGRLAAMQTLKWERCGIKRFRGSDSEATALAIALNRTAQFSTWDTDILESQLNELSGEFSMDSLGFEDKEMAEMFGAGNDPAEEESDESDAGDEKEVDIPNLFNLLVECEDEMAQEALFTELEQRGMKCRPLSL